MADDTAEAARALYGMDPENFIAARDELAKRMKADGDTEAAAAVKKLRRPTVAAWAVDGAARAEPHLVDELLAAGARLTDAQRRAMSGMRGANDLRTATEERRELIRHLTGVAMGVLQDGGRPSETSRDEIARTFEAATLDPDVAARLRDAVLDKTVRPSSGLGDSEGLQLLEGGAGEPAEPRKRTAARESANVAKAADHAERAAAEAVRHATSARSAADAAAREAKELAATAAEAERDAKRLTAEAKTARARAGRAARA